MVSKHLAVSNSLIHQDTLKSASLSNSQGDKVEQQTKDEPIAEVDENGENLDDSITEAKEKRVKHMNEV